MGQFDFRDKWESGFGKTESDENKFGGQSIDETKDNPLLQELGEFKSADSSLSVPDDWREATSVGGSVNPWSEVSGNTTGAACVSSTSCPSGWSCVDGFCRKTSLSTTTNGGASVGAGDCDIEDLDGRIVTRQFQCGSSSTRTSCQNGGTCGEGARLVTETWYNSWSHTSDGGCCNSATTVSSSGARSCEEEGTEGDYGYGGGGGSQKCTLFCNAIGAYNPEFIDFFNCRDKMCKKPNCQECHFGQCRYPPLKPIPCQCKSSPCPTCSVCNVSSGQCDVLDATKEECLTKSTYRCSCVCGEPVEVEGFGVTKEKADDDAREKCKEKCGGEIPDCRNFCRIQCNCNADCLGGTCGPDLRCEGTEGAVDKSYIWIQAGES